MVGWYSPQLLLKAGVEVIVSTLFGQHADQRTVQALTAAARLHDYSSGTLENVELRPEIVAAALPRGKWLEESHAPQLDDFWFDYVADVGDGWDSTYSIAYQITRPTLTVQYSGGDRTIGPSETVEGRLLIFGGDQVYPIASRAEYDRRLLGPYTAALSDGQDREPIHVYAIPGNHDWYDSLRSFSRIFFTDGPFVPDAGSATDTPQARSYFAIKLPHDWWIIATDVQLGSDIDGNQWEYFKTVKAEMGPRDRVILCTAEPHWLRAKKAEKRESGSAETALDRLERELFGGKVEVFIAGDVHHYMRYEATDNGRTIHKITAGGGGAFLHPTHRSWDRVIEDRTGNGATATSRRFQQVKGAVFPPAGRSFLIGLWNGLFAFLNPRFGLLTAILYLVFAMMMLPAFDRFAASQKKEQQESEASKLQLRIQDLNDQVQRLAANPSEPTPPPAAAEPPELIPPQQQAPIPTQSIGGREYIDTKVLIDDLKSKYPGLEKWRPVATSSPPTAPVPAAAPPDQSALTQKFEELERVSRQYTRTIQRMQNQAFDSAKQDLVQRIQNLDGESQPDATGQVPASDVAIQPPPPDPIPDVGLPPQVPGAGPPIGAAAPADDVVMEESSPSAPAANPLTFLWHITLQEVKFPNSFESMLAIVVFAAGIAGFVAFTDIPSPAAKWVLGTFHGMVHWFAAYLLTFGVLAALASQSNWVTTAVTVTVATFGVMIVVLYVLSEETASPSIWKQIATIVVCSLLFLALVFLVRRQEFRSTAVVVIVFIGGWVFGATIMGAYLFLTHTVTGNHWNEAFSSVRCKDWKCFVRFRIDSSGALTIFPIGIRRVCRAWTESGSHVRPRADAECVTELIEPPITLPRTPAAENAVAE